MSGCLIFFVQVVGVSFKVKVCLLYKTLFKYIGLFSHTHVSFHIYRSLFTLSESVSKSKYVSCIKNFSHIHVSFHIYMSLFTYIGLFSHIHVSFHECGTTTLSMCVMSCCLIFCVQVVGVSFRVKLCLFYRSLFTYTGLFSQVWQPTLSVCIMSGCLIFFFPYVGVSIRVKVGLFHRSLFTYIGLFSQVWHTHC